MISSVTSITLGFCDFRYKRGKFLSDGAVVELISILAIYLYALFEIIFGIESDPLYFAPESAIARVLGINYKIFLPLYILFVIFYFNLFYIFTLPKARKMKKLGANLM